MTNKVFPIRNESACVYKWGWNTFRLFNATSSSCHRVKPVFVSLDDFDNFNNTPEIIDDRLLMLDGKWPVDRGCEYCQEIELQGGVSDRTYHNDIPGLTPVDFTESSTHATPRIVEVYLNNTCDLACVYCIPEFSSRINDELNKFGPNVIGLTPVTKISNRDQYLEKYIAWLDANYTNISRLAIQGGEPLLQKEFWTFLDFLQTREHKELELSINTNLNASSGTLERFVEIAKKLLLERRIKRVDINCSLDCFGPQAEFVRSGLDLAQWQRNFEYLIQHKWLYITVQHTVTSLSIRTAQELQSYIAECKQINPRIVQAYQIVDGPNQEIYRPEIFGGEFFKQQLDQLLSSYPIATEWDNTARQRLEGIVKLVASGKMDVSRLTKLKATLEQIDIRRKSNWQTLFPHIDEYFNNNGIE